METKFCFNCGNKILENSNFCPNCGTPISVTSPIYERQQRKDMAGTPNLVERLVISFLITCVLLLFIGACSLVFSPVGGFVVVILTAIWVYTDAKNIGAGKGFDKEERSTETWSPLSWSLLVLFLWIVGMPLYLVKRRVLLEKD